MKVIKQDMTIKKMVVEVMKHARSQSYTPQQLCERQKIIDAQFFYYWAMDMKKRNISVICLQKTSPTGVMWKIKQLQRIRQ